MVEAGKTNAAIGYEIGQSYDAVDRHLVWNYVFHFQDLGLGRPSSPEWLAIVRAYRTTKAVRPSEEEVAEEMGISERTLALKLRSVKIERWDDVHAWVATED